MGFWIVVVDDEPLSLTNAKAMLNRHDMRVSCLRSGQDLLRFMEKNSPDLILLDILMPGMDGFDTYRALRQFEEGAGRAQIPVIFLTGEDNHETERRGLKAGASDFIHKPFDEDILLKRIHNSIVNSKTIESLTEEATLDRLTGFLNKASGTEKVSGLCRETTGALMILDLDNFKLVNDLYGHDMGDRVLVEFASIFRYNVRKEDVISRIGGDEFLAFFPQMTHREEVAAFTHRLNEQLTEKAEQLMGKGHGIPLGISVGVSFVPSGTDNFRILFQYADSALYEVKRNGKHGYRIYDPEISVENVEDDPEKELHNIIQIISERGEIRGGMLLGQEAFSWNYRFIQRFMTRFDGEAARVLFSLSSDEKGVIYTEMVSEFGNVLKDNLRKTDIILQWRQNRYFAVLPLLAENDISRLVGRVMKAWSRTPYGERLKVSYVTSMLRKERHEREK